VLGDHFVVAGSNETFTPWGFTYDRDWQYRLLEDYWADEWGRVEQDFGELHALGANVVRISLQYHRFMDGPNAPNETNLARLRQLVTLAESHGIYLDIVGLASFRPGDDPKWYVDLDEQQRWAAQAKFWETIAATLADRPGVLAFKWSRRLSNFLTTLARSRGRLAFVLLGRAARGAAQTHRSVSRSCRGRHRGVRRAPASVNPANTCPAIETRGANPGHWKRAFRPKALREQ
jgi:hypothetical protein